MPEEGRYHACVKHRAVAPSPLSPEAAKASDVTLLPASGYQPSTPTFFSGVEFERGSWAAQFTTIAARNWKVKVAAEFEPVSGGGCEARMEWEIHTIGQLVMKPDTDYWRAEVAATVQAARGEGIDAAGVAQVAARSIKGNIWRVGIIFSCTVGPFIPYVWTGQDHLLGGPRSSS